MHQLIWHVVWDAVHYRLDEHWNCVLFSVDTYDDTYRGVMIFLIIIGHNPIPLKILPNRSETFSPFFDLLALGQLLRESLTRQNTFAS